MNTPDDDFIEEVGNTEYAKIKSVDIDRLLRICDGRKAALAVSDKAAIEWQHRCMQVDMELSTAKARIKELTEALESIRATARAVIEAKDHDLNIDPEWVIAKVKAALRGEEKK
jgi:hypothetical protein